MGFYLIIAIGFVILLVQKLKYLTFVFKFITIKIMYKLLLLSAVLLLLGCGGSSQNTSRTGLFLDSPVAGVQYRVFFNDGNVGDIKVTDSNGRFSYDGDAFAISFFLGRDPVGRINLGSSTIKPTITLLDLLPEGETRAIDHPKIVAMAQLLQSLDDDGDIAYAINISSQTLAKINEMSDNSDTTLMDLGSDPASKIVQVLEMAQATKNLVPFRDVKEHLRQSLEAIQTNEQNPLAPYNVVAARSDASLTFFWQGTANTDSYDLYITRGTSLTNQHYEDFATSKHSDVTSPYTITDLTNGVTYSYFIVAINDIGEQPSVVKQAVPVDLLYDQARESKREFYNDVIRQAQARGEDYRKYCSDSMLLSYADLSDKQIMQLNYDVMALLGEYSSASEDIHQYAYPYGISDNGMVLTRVRYGVHSTHIRFDMRGYLWATLDERITFAHTRYGETCSGRYFGGDEACWAVIEPFPTIICE